MKIRFKQGAEMAALPLAAAALEPELGELDMRLLLTLAAKGELDENDLDALAAAIGCPRGEIDLSVSYLRGAGILAGRGGRRAVPPGEPVVPAVPVAPGLPSYTAAEVERIFAAHSELRSLLELCQNTLGRVFNTTEANTILGLRDYLGLDEAYILILLTYCAGKDKRSLRYIEKMAFSLHDEGVDTTQALEDYLRRRERLDAAEGKLRHLFGMGSRALTGKEKAAFARWEKASYSDELIALAYETTVNAIREPSVPYTDKILESWQAAGYKTPADVEAARSGTAGTGVAGTGVAGTGVAGTGTVSVGAPRGGRQAKGNFDTDDFFEAALRRSYGKKNDGGDGT